MLCWNMRSTINDISDEHLLIPLKYKRTPICIVVDVLRGKTRKNSTLNNMHCVLEILRNGDHLLKPVGTSTRHFQGDRIP